MRLFVVSLIMTLCLGFASNVLATGPALKPDMVRLLESLQERLADEEYAEVASQARRAAARLQGGNAADRWARALFLQLTATAEARRANEGEAADLLQTARHIDGVDAELRRRWLYQEAQLRLRAGQTAQAATLLENWLSQGRPDADSLWLMAQIQGQLEHWDTAVEWLDRARRNTSTLTDTQLRLAASLYQRAGDSEQALSMLDRLLERAPDDPDTWRRAAALAQRLEVPGRAAALWEAGWRKGALTDDEDLERLIQLHLAGGTPARAAEHLAQALDDGRLADNEAHARLLAQAWTAARDHVRALEAWQALAERTQAAKDWQQLGELAYGWGRWTRAIAALRQAREAGIETHGRNRLLEGVAQLEQGDTQAARQAFSAARDAGVAQAETWLTILDERRSEPESLQSENSAQTGA
ncbi:tetratricopeptide repeat protein [Halomonas sp. WWR20]